MTSSASGRRVLLAWEFGAGRTHALNTLCIARFLREAGVECLATFYEPTLREEFAAIGVPMVQTVVWPGRRRAAAGWQEREVRALGDVLVNLGMTMPGALSGAIGHYEALFALFQPNLVLAENAFGAMLAARGRMPCLAFGTNASLPPVRDGRFALRPDTSATEATFPEEDVCAALNRELAAAGREPLAALTEIVNPDHAYPYGPPAFDTYGRDRDEPILPSPLPISALPSHWTRGTGVFAYLHAFVQGTNAVLNGLRRARRPTTLYLPGLLDDARPLLGAAVHVSEAAMPLPWILSEPRCVVHHGGVQLTTACLAAGRPQVILAKELDNELTGRFVAERGLGFARHVLQADESWLKDAIRQGHDDEALASRCRDAAAEFRSWTEPDPNRTVADAALRVLARAPPA